LEAHDAGAPFTTASKPALGERCHDTEYFSCIINAKKIVMPVDFRRRAYRSNDFRN
jgi:hypothetical protein